MAVEIERKFLLHHQYLDELIANAGTPIQIRQGYIPTVDRMTVRVRVADDRAFLTLKGPSTDGGISRSEFEYKIPTADAHAMLNELCSEGVIEKNRYRVLHARHTWEIDVFSGLNSGLVVAEVELGDVDEKPDLPEWIANEVSGQLKYYNSALAVHPFSKWLD